jgi:hypothetical protein
MFRKISIGLRYAMRNFVLTSSVASVIRAMELKVMKCAENIADLQSQKSQAKQSLLRSGQALRVPED